jgi:hypothetical protein
LHITQTDEASQSKRWRQRKLLCVHRTLKLYYQFREMPAMTGLRRTYCDRNNGPFHHANFAGQLSVRRCAMRHHAWTKNATAEIMLV